MTMQIQPPWSVPVLIAELPETGQHFDLSADAEVRAGMARLAGLRALPELTASFDVVRRGAGVAVNGTVRARVGQTCVITLEPIENMVSEDVDLLFAPGAADAVEARGALPRTEAEPPEPLLGDSIDLGAVATEFLILGLDPYPRKEGAQFAAASAGEAATAHPFAALAALKKGSTGGGE